MNKDFLDFLNFLKATNQTIFIEVEATKAKMNKFIIDYNNRYSSSITIGSDGICLLGNVDKWGVELRIYFSNLSGITPVWNKRKYVNSNYRSDEFKYRLDDNGLVEFLFNNGYHLGYN